VGAEDVHEGLEPSTHDQADGPAGASEAGLAFAIRCARIAEQHRSEEILVLDLRGISPVADFFVICTGTSDRQMRTVADRIAEHAKTVGRRVFGVAGYELAHWILLDYVDVVVHIFDADHRHYYDLELLWGDAPRVPWQAPEPHEESPAS